MKPRLKELLGECSFKVGDMAYYRSPESKYCVRKAKVCRVKKEKRYIDCVEHVFIRPYYVITLENGVTMPSEKAFVSRQEAEACFVEELKTDLTFQQVQLENLQHEIAYKKAVLKRLTQKQSEI